jgi:hypothetical protein
MGSRQKAVEAFVAVCNDAMLDRWIPDEDWVRQIRFNGCSECSVTNLNMGMSKQCAWQNNHATLQGISIFYNKKKVLISKDKAKNKHTSFYYALSPSNLAPTVPSDTAFYQSIWDDPARSTRLLKRKAPQATAKANKSKTFCVATAGSSHCAVSDSPSLSSPPTTFEAANRMVQEAWKVAFPSLRFPVEFIGVFPSRKSPLVAAPHEASHQHQPALMHQSTNGCSKLKVAINKNLESQLLKERAFFKALKATVAREQTESTPQARRLLAAFAATATRQTKTLTFFVAKLCARSPPTPLPSTTTNGW